MHTELSTVEHIFDFFFQLQEHTHKTFFTVKQKLLFVRQDVWAVNDAENYLYANDCYDKTMTIDNRIPALDIELILPVHFDYAMDVVADRYCMG